MFFTRRRMRLRSTARLSDFWGWHSVKMRVTDLCTRSHLRGDDSDARARRILNIHVARHLEAHVLERGRIRV